MRIREGLCVLVMLLAGCAKVPAQARLRERIDAMQAAIQAREVSRFMDGVAADFIGSGNLDRAALQQVVRLQVMRNAVIGVTVGPVQVQLQGARATVELEAVLTGGAGGLLPERAQAYRIHSGWRESEDGWQVYHAEWTPAL